MDGIFSESKFAKVINSLFSNQANGSLVSAASIPSKTTKTTGSQINSKIETLEKVPLFPVEAFPVKIQELIKAAKESLNFPPDFFGTSILSAVSIAVGNTYNVEVKTGWQEKAVLFVANVGRPNTNKSHPLSFALDPIHKRDQNTFIEYQKLKNAYDQAVHFAKHRSKSNSSNQIAKPIWEKSLVTDITPEALVEVHKNNTRGLGVHADELAGWFKNFNRYHKGSDQEFWLSVWSGKPINVDRKNSDSVFIPQPFISVIGNIPTGILQQIGQDSRSQNGFIDRILFAYPDELEKSYWSESELDPVFIVEWKKIIKKLFLQPLLLDENSMPAPKTLKFNAEAFDILKEWEKKNTDLCNKTTNESLAGIYGKFDIHVVRLSLILQMLQFACGEEELQSVGVKAVKNAIRLTDYFQATATKVHSIVSNNSPLKKLPDRYQKLYEALPDHFKTSEAQDIGKLHQVPVDTLNKWLKRGNNVLFRKIRLGEYEKLV